MNDAHCWDCELDRSGLDWHEGGVSCQAGGHQLDPPDWDHAVRGTRRLLGVQGQVAEQVGLGLCSRCLGETLWGKVHGALGSIGGSLSAPVHWYPRFAGR